MRSLARQVVETHPQVEAQRSAVRALKARVDAARSGFLPSIAADGIVQRREINIVNNSAGDAKFTVGQASAEARYRLYDGARNINALSTTKEELAAGEAVLDATISDVLLNLLTSAADVQRDRQIRQYAQEQYDAIDEQLRATTRRFSLGEATRTDESQAKARLATSLAGTLSAAEELSVSSSAFEAASGQPADTVPALPALAPPPASLMDALAIAMDNSPRLESAKHTAAAAKEGVDFAKGALMPQVDAVGGVEYLTGGVANLFTGRLPNDRMSYYGGLELHVPLFQGGREYAEIRRAKAVKDQRMSQVQLASRLIAEEVSTAWARWQASIGIIEASRQAVAANEAAAEGVRKESLGGARTLLDVLDAQNELLAARVGLKRAERNEFVARASLLATLGKLQPDSILEAMPAAGGQS